MMGGKSIEHLTPEEQLERRRAATRLSMRKRYAERRGMTLEEYERHLAANTLEGYRRPSTNPVVRRYRRSDYMQKYYREVTKPKRQAMRGKGQ
ncbi:hypothetical protein IAK14_004229 [Salmonella enterica]|nr:hypothetical protein [Salmonella enterica]